MSNLYTEFYLSIQTASRHATILFLAALGIYVAYKLLDYINPRWRPFVKLGAWLYALTLYGAALYLSLGG